METSAEKTKVLTNSTKSIEKITVSRQKLAIVNRFKYLGAFLRGESSKTEAQAIATQTTSALAKPKPMWRDNNISLSSKLKLLHAIVGSVSFYACEK